jgi:hypothetical protein
MKSSMIFASAQHTRSPKKWQQGAVKRFSHQESEFADSTTATLTMGQPSEPNVWNDVLALAEEQRKQMQHNMLAFAEERGKQLQLLQLMLERYEQRAQQSEESDEDIIDVPADTQATIVEQRVDTEALTVERLELPETEVTTTDPTVMASHKIANALAEINTNLAESETDISNEPEATTDEQVESQEAADELAVSLEIVRHKPEFVTNDSGPVEHKVFTNEPGEVISKPAKTQATTDEPVPAKATLNQTVETQIQVVTIKPPGSDAVTNEAADVILELAENQATTNEPADVTVGEITHESAEAITSNQPTESRATANEPAESQGTTIVNEPVEHEVTTRVPADTKKPAEITDDLVKVAATNELVVNEVTISEPERQVTANEPAPTKAVLSQTAKTANERESELPLPICCGNTNRGDTQTERIRSITERHFMPVIARGLGALVLQGIG